MYKYTHVQSARNAHKANKYALLQEWRRTNMLKKYRSIAYKWTDPPSVTSCKQNKWKWNGAYERQTSRNRGFHKCKCICRLPVSRHTACVCGEKWTFLAFGAHFRALSSRLGNLSSSLLVMCVFSPQTLREFSWEFSFQPRHVTRLFFGVKVDRRGLSASSFVHLLPTIRELCIFAYGFVKKMMSPREVFDNKKVNAFWT